MFYSFKCLSFWAKRTTARKDSTSKSGFGRTTFDGYEKVTRVQVNGVKEWAYSSTKALRRTIANCSKQDRSNTYIKNCFLTETLVKINFTNNSTYHLRTRNRLMKNEEALLKIRDDNDQRLFSYGLTVCHWMCNEHDMEIKTTCRINGAFSCHPLAMWTKAGWLRDQCSCWHCRCKPKNTILSETISL